MIGAAIFAVVMTLLTVTVFTTCVIKGCDFTYALSTEELDIIKKHNYTEKEYITLFNYCVRKQNLYADDYSNKSRYMYAFLDNIREDATNPYIKPDYNDLCSRLLTLIPEDERKKINFAILEES